MHMQGGRVTQRFTIDDTHPAMGAMHSMEDSLRQGSLEHSLQELVKMRASQINGCAFCLDMHSKDARQAGESEQRLYALNAWPEAPFYSDRERAALAWTESVTQIAETGVPDVVYQQARQNSVRQSCWS